MMIRRLLLLFSAVLASLGTFPVRGAEHRVIIVSPHNEAIRYEFGRAFAQWHLIQSGEPAKVEWRDAGGTSDALRFVQSEFANKPNGIGIDCFFGGGQEPYLLLADRKFALPYKPPPEILDGIPESINGVELYDASHTWHGAAISSFGILQSTRVQRLADLPPATRWSDLVDPRLLDWVGGGDPRNSSTMLVMYESLLQFYGWDLGWQMLTRLGGNIRKFDRVSTSTAKDVTLGETAYALAIDFYGFTQVAIGGRSNLTFALPQDFTALNPDGLAILKGAPNLATAERFVDFVLSEAGQKLWFLPRGHPGGAVKNSIERMSIRPDFYARYKDVSNIAYSPFEVKNDFRYNAKLARDRRDILSALFGALLVDTHTELQSAWRAVIRRGLKPEEVAEFGRVPLTEKEMLAMASADWKNPAFRNRKKIEWQSWAQAKYRGLVEGQRSKVE